MLKCEQWFVVLPPTSCDASPSDGGGGPGAFFRPNTLFILYLYVSVTLAENYKLL